MINKIINPVRIAVTAIIGISALSIPVTAQTNENQQAPTNIQKAPTNTPDPASTTDTLGNTTQPSTFQRPVKSAIFVDII